MPTIVQALKMRGRGLSIRHGDRWLYWWEKFWRVREGLKTGEGKEICVTKDQHTAVDYLLGKR